MNRKILIADNDAVFWMACFLTGDSGSAFDVDIAQTPDQCRDAVARHDFDLVVLDISFGAYRCDGFALVPEIRRVQPTTKIVMFSSMDGPPNIAMAKSLGAKGLLSKRDITIDSFWREVTAILKPTAEC